MMKTLNLDKVLPDPKEIVLGGKSFVFPKVYSKYTLRFAKLTENAAVTDFIPILQDMFNEICPVDENFIADNASMEEIQNIVIFLFGKNDEKKNQQEPLTQ
jgi:hypothetical protein